MNGLSDEIYNEMDYNPIFTLSKAQNLVTKDEICIPTRWNSWGSGSHRNLKHPQTIACESSKTLQENRGADLREDKCPIKNQRRHQGIKISTLHTLPTTIGQTTLEKNQEMTSVGGMDNQAIDIHYPNPRKIGLVEYEDHVDERVEQFKKDEHCDNPTLP